MKRLFAALLAVPAVAAADVTLAHSGYLLNASDQPLTGTTALSFSLHATASDASPLWSGACSASVKAGYFAVVLGDGTCGAALPDAAIPAGAERFLQVSVDSVTLTPRLRLGAAATALDAAKLAGKLPSAFWQKTEDLSAAPIGAGTIGGRVGALESATAGFGTRIGTLESTSLTLAGAQTISGLKTFDRGASLAPFAVGSATAVTNLNADLLDGRHASEFALASALPGYLPLTGGTLTGGLTIGNSDTCEEGRIRYRTAVKQLELCNGTTWVPLQVGYYRSCKEIRDAGLASGSKFYTIDLDGGGPGAPLDVYCDMDTDGGGWTLGVNINTDLGAIDLAAYTNRHASPLTVDYGVNMNAFTRTTSTEYRLTCVETSDAANRKLFVKGLLPSEPIFQAAGTITKTSVVCSQSQDFSSPVIGASCFSTDDGIHTYYAVAGWDVNWALFASGTAYTLRHCRQVGTGYHNKGRLWFR